jgi:hypothetical protein
MIGAINQGSRREGRSMSSIRSFRIKQFSLYLLIVSVFLSAVLGIWALLSGRDFDWVEVRILLTTVTISGASICGLGCGAFWETGRGRILPIIGIALAITSAVLLITGMWVEVDSEGYWKTAVILTIFAVAAAHLSLLSIARLARQFSWAWIAAYVSILGLALIISAMVIGEVDDDWAFRLVGVVSIISASFSILIPVFHRLSKTTPALRSASSQTSFGLPAEGEESIDAELARLRARIAELEARKRQGG